MLLQHFIKMVELIFVIANGALLNKRKVAISLMFVWRWKKILALAALDSARVCGLLYVPVFRDMLGKTTYSVDHCFGRAFSYDGQLYNPFLSFASSWTCLQCVEYLLENNRFWPGMELHVRSFLRHFVVLFLSRRRLSTSSLCWSYLSAEFNYSFNVRSCFGLPSVSVRRSYTTDMISLFFWGS